MAKLIPIFLLFLVGCSTRTVYKYKEVKVPVPVPCKAMAPGVEKLPVEQVNELTARALVENKQYGEFLYRIGSSLVILDGDVKAYREVLGACQ